MAAKIDRMYAQKELRDFNSRVEPYGKAREDLNGALALLSDKLAAHFWVKDENRKKDLLRHLELSVDDDGQINTDAFEIQGVLFPEPDTAEAATKTVESLLDESDGDLSEFEFYLPDEDQHFSALAKSEHDAWVQLARKIEASDVSEDDSLDDLRSSLHPWRLKTTLKSIGEREETDERYFDISIELDGVEVEGVDIVTRAVASAEDRMALGRAIKDAIVQVANSPKFAKLVSDVTGRG